MGYVPPKFNNEIFSNSMLANVSAETFQRYTNTSQRFITVNAYNNNNTAPGSVEYFEQEEEKENILELTKMLRASGLTTNEAVEAFKLLKKKKTVKQAIDKGDSERDIMI